MANIRYIDSDTDTGAPDGEKNTLTGTELFPISGNQVARISSVKTYTLGNIYDSDVNFTDITTGNSSINKHGFLPKLDSDSDATKFLNGIGGWTTPAGISTVYDSDIVRSDTTANNADSDAHGFLKKLDSNAAHYMDGSGNWSTPAGGGGTVYDSDIVLQDITTNNADSDHHGFLLKLTMDTSLFLRADGSWQAPPSGGTVYDSDIVFSDTTANNSTISQHGFLPKLDSDSDATHFLNGIGGWTAPAGGGSSVLIQQVITETGASATGTTLMPLDDTIPQNTEGDEYMTRAITPTNAASILYIEVVLFAVHSTGAWISAALFQDSVANALAAMTTYSTTAGGGSPIVFRHKMVAGTTSAITFKVRAGNHLGAGTVTFNGNAGNRIFGGVCASSITVSELTP